MYAPAPSGRTEMNDISLVARTIHCPGPKSSRCGGDKRNQFDCGDEGDDENEGGLRKALREFFLGWRAVAFEICRRADRFSVGLLLLRNASVAPQPATRFSRS